MSEGKAAFVDKETCSGCGICEDICSEKAISVNDYAEINETKCTGCGDCVEECPSEAIRLK